MRLSDDEVPADLTQVIAQSPFCLMVAVLRRSMDEEMVVGVAERARRSLITIA